MKFSVASMNEWLYPDIFPEVPVTEAPSLTVARGGSTGFQIRLTDVKAGNIEAIYAGTVPLGCEVFLEKEVYVPQNTGDWGFTTDDWELAKTYVTRKAPFYVYDALRPIGESGIEYADKDAAVYISLTVDAARPAGQYSLTLYLYCGGEEINLTVNVTVVDAVLPAETIRVTNWFSLKQMADAHNAEMWSPKHWNIIEQYGRLMRRTHQNVFWITHDTIEATSDSNGYHFDFTNCERLIKLYLSLGFVNFEGPMLYGRQSWDKTEFFVHTPDGREPALSEKGYAYSAAFFTAWEKFLREHGWRDLVLQHVGDEPHERCGAEYRILSGIVRKFMPNVKIIDAIETHTLRGAVDIWVPKCDYYERNRDALETLRSQGDDIWFYTCCIPGGKFANRLLDFPLLRTRMLLWGCYRYGLSGYLHWGLNHWHDDPYKNTCPPNSPNQNLPAGDSHILYPDGDRPIGSMRAEMMKCSAEDYELLRLSPRADEICAMMFRRFNDCDNTPDAFEKAHTVLLTSFD